MTRTHALRNFQICDERGQRLVRADSQWLLFDTDKKRTTRIPKDEMPYATDEPRLDMSPFERKIKIPEDATTCTPFVVGEQNLDTNRHVNNAQYVLFALDALSELGHNIELSQVSVQYRKMAWLGDSITPVVHNSDTGWVVELGDGESTNYSLVKLQGR